MAGFNLVRGGRGHNYTGILTRSIVFSGALLAFLAGEDLIANAHSCLGHRSPLTMLQLPH